MVSGGHFEETRRRKCVMYVDSRLKNALGSGNEARGIDLAFTRGDRANSKL